MLDGSLHGPAPLAVMVERGLPWQVLIRAFFGFDSRFPFIFMLDSYLMVPVTEISLKRQRSGHYVRHVIKPGDQEMILNGDLADRPAIDIHPPIPIFL